MRRLVVLLVVLTVSAACTGPAAAQAPAGDVSTVVIPVQPAMAGVPLILHGVRYVSDADGNVSVPATAAEQANENALLHRLIRVPETRLTPTLRVRFSRWVGTTATVLLLRPVEVRLVGPTGRSVRSDVAPRVVVRGIDGSEHALVTGKPSWLAAGQAVRRPDGAWRVRRLSYAINAVLTHGTNAVHRGQQRFTPSTQRRLTVTVLFFEARITSRDALFGSAVGTSVTIRFPDGRTERHALDSDGEILLTDLPRGDYVVHVEGAGISFSRPVALSKSQDVELRVITWLDAAVVTLVLLVFAVGILVAGRPDLRRLLRVPAWRASGGRDHG
jgi:hypothetical protein